MVAGPCSLHSSCDPPEKIVRVGHDNPKTYKLVQSLVHVSCRHGIFVLASNTPSGKQQLSRVPGLQELHKSGPIISLLRSHHILNVAGIKAGKHERSFTTAMKKSIIWCSRAMAQEKPLSTLSYSEALYIIYPHTRRLTMTEVAKR